MSVLAPVTDAQRARRAMERPEPVILELDGWTGLGVTYTSRVVLEGCTEAEVDAVCSRIVVHW